MKLSDLDFYMKPTKYTSGEVDKSGVKTRKVIEEFFGLRADEIYMIGDTESMDFDCEEMEILYDAWAAGKTLNAKDLDFDEGWVYVHLTDNDLGRVCKVWSESAHGETVIYFGDWDAWYAISQGAIEVEEEVESKSKNTWTKKEVKTLFDRFTEFVAQHNPEEWDGWIEKNIN